MIRLLPILFLSLSVHTQLQAATRPNVLLIMTDDQGYGDIGSHGNPDVKTPVLDGLAESGARFDRFYVSPVCAPTRASLLTGRYHLRTGVYGVTRGYENLRAEEVTLAEVFQQAGYATGCFGKWHNGRHMPLHPNGQGFETFIGFCGGHWNTYFNPPLEHNGNEIVEQGYIADIFTEKAASFIKHQRDEPWLCYVAYNTPHSPWRIDDETWKKYDGLGLDTRAQCAYAMVDNIDTNVGKLLKLLDEQKCADNTIVLFLTDNGANSDRFNAGMKGRKGSVDEGGTRVPLFVRYPKKIRAGTVIKPLAFHLDLLPTLAELCEVTLTAEHYAALDGQSLVPLLSGEVPESWPQRMYFTENYRNGVTDNTLKGAVRTERWRAVMHRSIWQLYDMQVDPGQKNNIARQNPDVTKELAQAFEDWLAGINPQQLSDPVIPVGHPTRTEFEIPAHEAFLEPGFGDLIQYTGDTVNGFANAWITNWTSTEAYPHWHLNVLEPGRYRVHLRYCCRAEDVGCQLELRAGEQALVANVPVAHDPPLLKKTDRVYSENYQDKTSWANMDMGGLTLKQGETELSLRLKTLEGDYGIELKSIVLNKVP